MRPTRDRLAGSGRQQSRGWTSSFQRQPPSPRINQDYYVNSVHWHNRPQQVLHNLQSVQHKRRVLHKPCILHKLLCSGTLGGKIEIGSNKFIFGQFTTD